MTRIIRRLAAVLMISMVGYGLAATAAPAHHAMATTGSGPLPDASTALVVAPAN